MNEWTCLSFPYTYFNSFGSNALIYVMVNFMYQFDWTIGCPDMWSIIILSALLRVFWMSLIFNQSIMCIVLPNVDEPHPISWRPKQNKKTDLLWITGNSSHSSWDIGFYLSSNWTETSALPGSWTHWSLDCNYISGSLDLQLEDSPCRS